MSKPTVLDFLGYALPEAGKVFDADEKLTSNFKDLGRAIRDAKAGALGSEDDNFEDSVSSIESEYDWVDRDFDDLLESYTNVLSRMNELESIVGAIGADIEQRLTDTEREDWDKQITWHKLNADD